jgi:glycosyltransferase involved in cell wall biosynthesis
MHNKYLENIEITLVGPSPDAGTGGIWVGGLISMLKSAGCRINLLSHDPSYISHRNQFKIQHRKIDELLFETTIIFPTRWPRFLKGLILLLFNFAYTWRSSKTSHLVYATASSTIALFIPVIIAAKLRRKPIVLDYFDKESGGIPDVVCKYFMRKATLIFAISHYLVDKARNYGCKNVVYLPAFVDTELFKLNGKARERTRDEWGIGQDDIVIGYAGGLGYSEGVPVLLQAVKGLSSRHRNVRLLVRGTKALYGRADDIPKFVEELNLEDIVILVPLLPRVKVPNFLSACDILCSPRIDCDENKAAFPIKVVEYLSMGIPAVCSSIDEVSRVIKHKVNGFLAQPGDARDLENVLEEVISNLEDARRIGNNGRIEAMEKYSYEVIGNTLSLSLKKVATNNIYRNTKETERKLT